MHENIEQQTSINLAEDMFKNEKNIVQSAFLLVKGNSRFAAAGQLRVYNVHTLIYLYIYH